MIMKCFIFKLNLLIWLNLNVWLRFSTKKNRFFFKMYILIYKSHPFVDIRINFNGFRICCKNNNINVHSRTKKKKEKMTAN